MCTVCLVHNRCLDVVHTCDVSHCCLPAFFSLRDCAVLLRTEQGCWPLTAGAAPWSGKVIAGFSELPSLARPLSVSFILSLFIMSP